VDVTIRPVCGEDVEALVQLSLLAWAPVFPSFRQILGEGVYRLIWPDWRSGQTEAVEGVCRDGAKTTVYVAEAEGKPVGYIAWVLDDKDKTGEVQLLAVHPQYQNLGIGTRLNRFALDKMREGGMRLAKVETGGDPSHAPARTCYEKAGYTGLPLVRYFKNLTEE